MIVSRLDARPRCGLEKGCTVVHVYGVTTGTVLLSGGDAGANNTSPAAVTNGNGNGFASEAPVNNLTK